MGRILLCPLLLFALFSCKQQDLPDYSWHFESAEGKKIVEANINLETTLQSIHENPEYVDGVEGKGLRFDGNTTYIDQAFVKPLDLPVTLSTWAALETYPTDIAGFFSLYTSRNDAKYWVSACVDRYGKLLIGTNVKGQEAYFRSDIKVNKFEWFHIALVIEKNEITLILNGNETFNSTITLNAGFENILIGKDSGERYIHIFPTMHINGILDEIKIWNQSLSEESIQKNIIQGKQGSPANLNIPPSRFANDFHRPKFHVLPAANWTNETHGLIYHDNKYHIFNQKNGTNVFLGQINWGHFSSPDLLRWTEHRPVLTPEKGYDQMGIWSGHAIIDENDQPVIMYTGSDGKEFGMCLAYPEDKDLLSWEKYKGNPVVKGPPTQYKRPDMRDPYLWKEGDTWYMIIGYGIVEDNIEKGAVLYYKSEDLKNWESLGTLFKGNPEVDQSGVFWEMPIFWKMGDKYVFLVQPIPYKGVPAISIYWTGEFINERFIPDHTIPKKLEVINRLLSPSVAKDADGETVAMAIIPDLIPAELQRKHGWTHLYSIPRRWKLVDGIIHQTPHPVLKELRTEEVKFENEEVKPNGNLVLGRGHQVEILAELNPNSSTQFGLLLGKNSRNGEETKILFNLEKEQLIIDLSKSSQEPLIDKRIERGMFKLKDNQTIKLQIFIDGSVIEGFMNDKAAFTTRIFPDNENSNEIEFFADNGILNVNQLSLWQLKSSGNSVDF